MENIRLYLVLCMFVADEDPLYFRVSWISILNYFRVSWISILLILADFIRVTRKPYSHLTFEMRTFEVVVEGTRWVQQDIPLACVLLHIKSPVAIRDLLLN
jgi:hypothetical protein